MGTNSGRGVSTQWPLQGEGRALGDEAESSDGGEGIETHEGGDKWERGEFVQSTRLNDCSNLWPLSAITWIQDICKEFLLINVVLSAADRWVYQLTAGVHGSAVTSGAALP